MMPVFSGLKRTGAGRNITGLKLAWAKSYLKLCVQKEAHKQTIAPKAI